MNLGNLRRTLFGFDTFELLLDGFGLFPESNHEPRVLPYTIPTYPINDVFYDKERNTLALISDYSLNKESGLTVVEVLTEINKLDETVDVVGVLKTNDVRVPLNISGIADIGHSDKLFVLDIVLIYGKQ